MKYEIDTIPVWDALRADSECPLCLLENRSRQAALRYYLGPSVMVPEVRVEVNRVGFSPENTRLLAKDPNKLGLALVHHTRLKALRDHLRPAENRVKRDAENLRQKDPIRQRLSTRALKDSALSLSAEIRRQEQSCLIQKKIDDDVARYVFTLLHLWQKDAEFRTAWNRGRGTCLRHAPLVLEAACDHLSAASLSEFLPSYLELMDANLARTEEDVLAFTQTYDATHSRPAAGNPQGALERCFQKMAGVFPEYEDDAKVRKGPLMGTVRST